MTTLVLALVLLLSLPTPAAFWPTTGAGWVTLVGGTIAVIATLVTGLWGYFKFLAHLNGLGARVGAVEREQAAAKERDETLARSMERMTYAQEQLFKEIGEAKQQSTGCVEEMKDFTLVVGSKIDEFRHEFNQEMRHAGERLQAVETEIKLTRPRRGD